MTPYSLVEDTNIFEEHIASSFGVDVNQIGNVTVFIKEVGINGSHRIGLAADNQGWERGDGSVRMQTLKLATTVDRRKRNKQFPFKG